jgi:hypothetical protein
MLDKLKEKTWINYLVKYESNYLKVYIKNK